MATELAKAYVQIVPSAQGIQGSITNLMNGEGTSAGENVGKTFAASFGSMAAKAIAALGIGKMITDALGDTSEFETGMAKVNTLFSGTSEQFGQLQQDVLNLSSTYGLAASEFAEAAYSAESAGVPMENLTAMLDSSAKLAVAGFTDIDTALAATAKTMNAYGMTGEEAIGQVQRVLIQTQNLGITTVDELGRSLANVTPTAASAGVSFEQVGAALAQMTANGVPTAQATTQLRSAIAELSKSGTKADEAFRAAADSTEYAGMSFTEAMNAGADLGDVFGLMQQYADESGLSMLDLWSSVEGGNAAMAIAADVEKFNSNLESMATEADVVGAAYSTMADTFGTKMNQLKESATNFMINLFNGGDISASFDTMLANLGDVGEKLLGWITTGISTLGTNLPSLISSLVDFAGSFLGAIGEVDWIEIGASVVNGIVESIGVLGTKLVELVGGALEDVGKMDFTTIGNSIFGGITDVLGKAGETIGSLFEQGVNAAKEQDWPSIGDAVKTGVNLVLNGGAFLGEIFSAGAELIKAIDWTNVGTHAEDLIVAGLDGATSFVSTISGAADQLLTNIDWGGIGQDASDLMRTGLEGAGTILQDAFSAAHSFITEGIDWAQAGRDIQAGLGDVWSGLTSFIGGTLEGAGAAVEGIGKGVGTAAEGVGQAIAKLFNGDDARQAAEDLKQAMSDLEAAITNGKAAVETAAKSVASAILTSFQTDLSAANMNAVGQSMMTGLQAGIEVKVPDLAGKIASIIGDIKKGFEGPDGYWSAVGETILGGVQTGIVNKTAGFSSTVSSLVSGTKTVFEGPANYWSGAGETILSGVEQGVSNKTADFAATVSGVVGDTQSAFEGPAGLWTGTGEAILAGVRAGFGNTENLQAFATLVTTVRDGAVTVFEYGGKWSDVGADIIRGIIAGINEWQYTLYTTMYTIAVNALDTAKETLGISSPSKIMRDMVGRWIPAGIAEGIEENAGMVTDAMNELAYDTTADGFNAMAAQSMRIGQTAGNGMTSDTGSVVSAIQGLRNDLLNMKLVVGKKVFGEAVVDYGGTGVSDYIGEMESSMAYGYGT